MTDSDEVHLLRRRARRRLVGATAVVLFLVIVPPLFMDLEPRPVSSNLNVEIPSAQVTSGKIGGASARGASPTSSEAATAPSASVTTKQDPESANALASAAVPGATAATGVTAVAGGANTGEPAGSDLNLPTAAKQADATPAESKSNGVKPADAKPVAPRPAVPKAPDAKSSAGSSAEAKPVEVYIVPLGTFSERENALNVQRRAEQLGIPAFNEPVVTAAGERVRVRAGPFATHEQAERAHTRLRDAGLDALSTRKIEKRG